MIWVTNRIWDMREILACPRVNRRKISTAQNLDISTLSPTAHGELRRSRYRLDRPFSPAALAKEFTHPPTPTHTPTNGTQNSMMGVVKKTGTAPTPRALQRVNSETKFAVSLLLGVSRREIKSPDVSSERSAGSADTTPRLSESPSSVNGTQVGTYFVPVPVPPPYTESTPEEQRATIQRRAALARFRAKKQRRQFHKKVRYHVRKRLAESRPRYKGRFSKPPAATEDGDTKKGASSSSTN